RDQQAARPGGEMSFARMSNGAWVISRWNIRMPVLQTRLVRQRWGAAPEPEVSVREIRVEGGDLAMVTHGRDTLWARPPLVVQGRVVDSVTGTALNGASIAIGGTGLSARTDATGVFRIPDVLPGDYRLEVVTPEFERAGLRHETALLLSDSTAALAIKVPPLSQVAGNLCPGRSVGTLTGRVRGAEGTNVVAVAEWVMDSSGTRRWIEAKGDRRARFVFCDLPHDVPIAVHAESDSGGTAPRSVRMTAGRPIETIELAVDRNARNATLSGTVLNAQNAQPLPGVEVSITALGRSTTTDDRGAYRIASIPPGSYEITYRRVGYTPLTETLDLAARRNVNRQVVLGTVATLEAVEVRADASLRDFEANRALGLGVFMTRIDLEKWQGRQVGTMISQARGAHVARGRGGEGWIISKRFVPPGGEVCKQIYCPEEWERVKGMPAACYAHVYVDNVLMNPGTPTPPYDVSQISAERLEAVEWYPSRIETPMKYQLRETKCGVLVLHTRRFDAKPSAEGKP
ncbi:MAG TPA: carboxypeptidase regulatory-like domain-containing protein, partial [Gemmatimonadaceae bacterium]|nr:carboxypeptidase regulatory-like domain-containing protein [Gemmatimonadaceae bacterium]